MSDVDSDEEVVVQYGTPLEPYEEDEVPTKRKYQQPVDQYAVDAHGRRRFHGAFTGGFSAGFGNTVGTPEGWTPSTFKSSRAEKAQFSSQRPEDFMDEEDRGEYGIAPQVVQTHNDFSGQKRQRRPQYHDGPIPGEPVLQQLVRAVHETAAVRMLRAMGWREGQGTGERLTGHAKRKAKEQHKVYGCYVPPELRQNQETPEDEEEDSSEDSEFDFDTLFAPDDYEPYLLSRKSDRFGLGYSGLSRHSVLGNLVGEYGSDAGSSRSHLQMKDKGKKVSIRGQAFGVGAFEADDDDIYATEDMSHYDFAIGGPAAKPETKAVQNKSGNVLPGFVKASKPLPSVPSYPAPALPRDYTPAVAGARRSRFEPTTHKERDQGLGRHELTAKARGELLGEDTTPPTLPPTPVTHTNTQPNTQTDKTDSITTLLGRNVNFTSEKDKELNFISIKDSGKEISKVFKPFVGNPAKQARYEKYLEDKTALERDGDMDRLSEWEREREIVEFEQAAKLYKPLTGLMGDRFTHASQPDDALNPLSAVTKSVNHGLATPQQMEAAQSGVYGVMTRLVSDWRPEGLVCKRFNVPEIGGRSEPKKEDRPKVSYSIFSYLESSVHDKDSFAKEQGNFSGSKSIPTAPKTQQNNNKSTLIQATGTQSNAKDTIIQATSSKDNIQNSGFTKRLTVAEIFLKESEQNKNQGTEVTETINKFDKMDLYKSIFLSDSEEEEDVSKKNEVLVSDFVDTPKNVERNTSPPRGIFANIDFDELNAWRRPDNNKKEETKTPEKTIEDKKEEKTEAVEEMYGPKIPENLQKRLQPDVKPQTSIEIGSSSSEDSWVDASELKSKKKKKKTKKHKSKHKKKSKSKKKDR